MKTRVNGEVKVQLHMKSRHVGKRGKKGEAMLVKVSQSSTMFLFFTSLLRFCFIELYLQVKILNTVIFINAYKLPPFLYLHSHQAIGF